MAGNPRRNALFGVVSETCGLRRLDGGVRSRMRTRLSGGSTLETAVAALENRTRQGSRHSLMSPMPPDPFIREKFTRESSTARRTVREYFQRYPKEQFQTELEIWRYLPSRTIEFTMKRLIEPIEGDG